jgi:hypothetical protein
MLCARLAAAGDVHPFGWLGLAAMLALSILAAPQLLSRIDDSAQDDRQLRRW